MSSLDLVIFALIFSEFGYVPDFFYVPNFFLEHSQILKKSRQKWLSPKLFSECQVLYLCFLLHKFLKTLKFSKCQVLDLVIFALIFSEFGYVPRKSLGHRKNLEHSQIQKKIKAKMTKSKTWHLEKIYTWTRLVSLVHILLMPSLSWTHHK